MQVFFELFFRLLHRLVIVQDKNLGKIHLVYKSNYIHIGFAIDHRAHTHPFSSTLFKVLYLIFPLCQNFGGQLEAPLGASYSEKATQVILIWCWSFSTHSSEPLQQAMNSLKAETVSQQSNTRPEPKAFNKYLLSVEQMAPIYCFLPPLTSPLYDFF